MANEFKKLLKEEAMKYAEENDEKVHKVLTENEFNLSDKIESFEDLEVWKLAHQKAKKRLTLNASTHQRINVLTYLLISLLINLIKDL